LATNQQTQLNLVISAQDQATKVIDAFAANIESSFSKIKEAMSVLGEAQPKFKNPLSQSVVNSFMTNAETMTKAMQDMSNVMGESTLKMDESIRTEMSAFKDLAKTAQEAFLQIQEGGKMMGDSMNGVVPPITDGAEKIKKSLNFGELMISGSIIKEMGKQVTDFFGEAISKSAEFDQSIVNTAASFKINLDPAMQNSTQAIETMKQKAIDLSNAGFFSANQIGDAMNVLAKQGVTYSQMMNGMIQETHNVAAANQEDLDATANVLTDIMHEMGESLKRDFGDNLQDQMQGVGNAMTETLHKARLSMDDYLNTMKYVGPLASATGVSITDLSAAIAILGEHGIRGTMAGNGLQRMLTNLQPQSDAAAATMEKLGLVTKDGGNAFFDASGHMKSLADVQKILANSMKDLTDAQKEQAIKTIFGQYAIKQMMTLINTAPDEFDAMTNAMKNQNAVTDALTEKSEGFGMQLQRLHAQFATFQKVIGEALRPLVESVLPFLEHLMVSFEKMNPGIRDFIIRFAAIGGVLIAVGGGILAFIATLGFLKSGLASFAEVETPLLAPFLGFIAISGAVVGAVVLLKKAWDTNFDGIREKTATVFAEVKKIVSEVITFVKPYWDEFAANFRKAFVELKPYAKEFLDAIFKGFMAALPAIESFGHAIAPIAKQVLQFAATHPQIVALAGAFMLFGGPLKVVTGLIGGLGNILLPIGELFMGVGGGALKMGSMVAGGASMAAKGIFSGAAGISGAIRGIPGLFGKLGEASTGVAHFFVLNFTRAGAAMNFFKEGVAHILTNTIAGFGSFFRALLSFNVVTWGKGILSAVTKAFSWTNIIGAAKGLITGFGGFLRGALTAMTGPWGILIIAVAAGVGAIIANWSKIKQWVSEHFGKNFPNTIKQFASTVGKVIQELGKIFGEVFDAIKNAVTAAWSYVEPFIMGAVNRISEFWKAHWDEIKQVLVFVWKVIQDVIGAALAVIYPIIAGALGFIKGIWSSVWNVIGSVVKTVFDTIVGVLKIAWDVISGIIGTALDILTGNWGKAWDTIKSMFVNLWNDILSFFGNLGGDLLNAGKNLMHMLVQGITSGIKAVGDAVSNVASKIKSFLGFSSPAKEGPAGPGQSDRWMPNMMNMFTKGIEENTPKLQQAVAKVAMGVNVGMTQTHQHVAQLTNSHKYPVAPTTKGNNGVIVNIQVDGHSAKTNKELAENIGKVFRTQMSMVSGK
jgi:TP901 family phage tail tape measure protein